MDYDSSTKFISSLAKFLQSLCNGYVEFDNGVQVIGHLYLNVDTGKTIDYVLNEKVCKTDENSVTFISNSFHAQPAEKPKPPGKRPDNEQDKNELKAEVENDQAELRGSNAGQSQNHGKNSPHLGAKRPSSPSKKDSKSVHSSHRNKKSRQDFGMGNSSLSVSENNAASPADMYQQSSTHEPSSFSESYQQNFFAGDENSAGDGQEQRDVKPSFDTDITFIKEEYAPSGLQSENQAMQDDGSQGDSSSGYPHSYPHQQFHPGGYGGQGSFNTNQRSTFNPAGYSGNSQLDGSDVSNDPSGGWKSAQGWSTRIGKRRHGKSRLGYQVNSGSTPSVKRAPPGASDSEVYFAEQNGGPTPEPTAVPEDDGSNNQNPEQVEADYFSAELAGSHEDNSAGRFLCHHCSNSYSDRRGLKRHLDKVSGKHYQCEICFKTFSRNDVYRRHVKLVHARFYRSQGGDSFYCDLTT